MPAESAGGPKEDGSAAFCFDTTPARATKGRWACETRPRITTDRFALCSAHVQCDVAGGVFGVLGAICSK
jgi:hypothetical protein